MKYFPSDSFEIECPLPKGEAIELLSRNIEPKKFFRFFGKHVYFQGFINTNEFEVRRIIKYRNSFLPIIKGKFASHDLGTTITLTMQLHPLVLAFMCVWFGGTGLFLIAFATAASPGVIGPLIMLLFGWALVTGGFWFEAKKQKEFLIDLLSDSGKSEQDAPADAKRPRR